VDTAPLPGPSALADDPSGITKFPDCAVAQSGQCVKPISRSKQEVCDRWFADRPAKADPVWIASSTSCAPGETPLPAQQDALRRLNLVRWIAGLDPVTLDATWSSMASACSIIQAYLGDISHFPDPSATCYTQQGGTASAQSQLAGGCRSAAACMDDLFWDWGENNQHIDGHRKGLMHPGLRTVGIGFSAPSGQAAACVRTSDGTGVAWPTGLAGLVPYPSSGHVPYEMISRESWAIYPETLLEWSMGLAPSTDLGTPSLRLYRQTDKGYEPLAMDSGKTPKAEIGGLWMLPSVDPVPPGTYVVLVEGTSLPAFGYRMILERCGADVPLTCSTLKQDCGAAGYGCYGSQPSTCAHAGSIPFFQTCKQLEAAECVPGADCRPKFDGKGTYTCQPYCDPASTTAANSCAKLCTDPVGSVLDDDLNVLATFCAPPF
jgi:hypothetical protein